MSETLTQDDFNTIATYNVRSEHRINKANIESFDSFLDNLPSLIEDEFVQHAITKFTPAKEGYTQVEYGLSFGNIKFSPPMEYYKGQWQALYPKNCKSSNKTYELMIHADINAWKRFYIDQGVNKEPLVGEKVEYKIENTLIGDIPIMTRSKICHLSGMSKMAQIQIGEDPEDRGGYFIIKGSSKVLIHRKNNIKNHPIVDMDSTGTISCKFMSQKGDQYELSYYLIINQYITGGLLINIPIGREQKFIAPIYILYYMLDKTVDQEIFQTILPDYDPTNLKHVAMATHFQQAMGFDYTTMKDSLSLEHFFAKYTRDKIQKKIDLTMIVAGILNATNKSKFTSVEKYPMGNETERISTYKEIVRFFDKVIFPHIGTEPKDRINKLNHLGNLVRKIFEIREGGDQTDRNSLENSRIYGPAPGLSSTFKSLFNYTTVTYIMNELRKRSQENPNFNIARIITSKIDGTVLGENMGKVLKAGNKPEITIKKDNKITNRITTNQRDYTNRGAEISVSHSITADPNSMGGKSNDKLVKSRSVHASEQGVKCIMQSIEGDGAGVVGQMALSAEYTSGINSGPIIEMLIKQLEDFDKMIEPDSTYSQVYVNGRPIGTHYDVRILAKEYRGHRRTGKIHPKISICYKPTNNGELHFYTDMGRIYHPSIIVYQHRNKVESKHNTWPDEPPKPAGEKAKTWQYILFTKQHAQLLQEDKITLDDLVADGVLEYLAPNEYMNVISCDSWETFLQTCDSRLNEYTHMSIPIAQLSLSILSCTYGNHAQPVRVVYNSKFVKQTTAFATTQYGTEFLQKVAIRHNVYVPIVKTVTDSVYNHGATPVVVMVNCQASNQEDSLVCSDTFVFNGKFSADLFSSTSIDVEVGYILCVPDRSTVSNVRGDDFSHLKANGLPKSGAVIYKGMAMVGMVQQVSNSDTKIDKSSYHRKEYPIVIVRAIVEYDNGQSQIVKISYKKTIMVEEGDKFGAKSGCKGVISAVVPHQEMPVSKEGLIPEMIINPNAFPSREIANQLMEGRTGDICARVMAYADATMYKKYDEAGLDKLAKELGIDDNGLHIMYDGKTSRRYRARICILYNGYQRLNKLAVDNAAVTHISNINMATQQPEKSINLGGGQRLGFMEMDTINAHGANLVFGDITFEDSDAKTVYLCNTCGHFAGVNEKKKIYRCNKCESTTFSKIRTCHTTLLIMNNIAVMGAGIKVKPEKIMLV